MYLNGTLRRYNKALADFCGNPPGYSKKRHTLRRFVVAVSQWLIQLPSCSLIVSLFAHSAGRSIFKMGSCIHWLFQLARLFRKRVGQKMENHIHYTHNNRGVKEWYRSCNCNLFAPKVKNIQEKGIKRHNCETER